MSKGDLSNFYLWQPSEDLRKNWPTKYINITTEQGILYASALTNANISGYNWNMLTLSQPDKP